MRNAVRLFEDHLSNIERTSNSLGLKELKNKQLLKSKYYVYSAFLGTMTSHPILHLRVEPDSVVSAVLAKTALVTSIKLLDNINDRFHEPQDLAPSQILYGNALINESFKLQNSDKWIRKAENTAYALARLCYDIIMRDLRRNRQLGLMYVFAKDVQEYISGQLNSFQQKTEYYSKRPFTLKEYIEKVSAKGFGKPWLDIDSCFFMANDRSLMGSHSPTESDWAVIHLLREGGDLIFKGLLFYDDVTDLEQDLSEGIINTSMMLGLELGRISKSELYDSGPELLSKLRSSQTTQDAIKIGDIFLLEATRRFRQIKLHSSDIAADALVFSCRTLRMFLLRKLVLQNVSPDGIKTMLSSFGNLKRLEATTSSETLSLAASLLPKSQSNESEDKIQDQTVEVSSKP